MERKVFLSQVGEEGILYLKDIQYVTINSIRKELRTSRPLRI